MSTPSDEASQPDDEPALDFDPYRFGAPEHPVPPEYAPPGYKPPPPTALPPPDPASVYPPQFPAHYPPPGYPSGYPPQYPYGQQPGGYPPPGYPPLPPQYNAQYPPPGNSNGRATASLVLGIVSIVLCFATIFDIIPIALAITFGVIGRRNAERDPRVGGKSAATAGIVCASVGAVLAIVLLVILTRAASHCSGYSQGSSDWTSCVEHQVHLK